jgi:hypothetical protein
MQNIFSPSDPKLRLELNTWWEDETLQIKVYQMKSGTKYRDLQFKELRDGIDTVNLDDYTLAWEAYRATKGTEDSVILEDLFNELNIGVKPSGYFGHSLSVSDLVQLGAKLYCCQGCGWKKVTASNHIKVRVAYKLWGSIDIEVDSLTVGDDVVLNKLLQMKASELVAYIEGMPTDIEEDAIEIIEVERLLS